MGTRNLTMVVLNKKPRIAQYGQWDGYPSGQGKTALKFLRFLSTSNAFMEKFKQQLLRTKFINKAKQKEIDAWLKTIGVNDGWMTMEQSEKYHQKYPLLTRDNGAEILQKVMNSEDKEIWLHNSKNFAADSLFCEWAYVIDLDKNTFEVYKGFNKDKLKRSERFGRMKGNKDYKPVKLVIQFPLDNLPTEEEFLKKIDEIIGVETE